MTPAREKIKVAVSRCLLGDRVRHDGGHKLDTLITESLAPLFDMVPFCPEEEAGMSVPREPVNIVLSGAKRRLIGATSGENYTGNILKLSCERVEGFIKMGVRGLVVKSKSPSCALFSASEFDENGDIASQHAAGMFTRMVTDKLPLMPVVEEVELKSAERRDNFVLSVRALGKWTAFLETRPSDLEDLKNFHQALEDDIRPGGDELEKLSSIIAEAGGKPLDTVLAAYGEEFAVSLIKLR